jgi:hypothetical protein
MVTTKVSGIQSQQWSIYSSDNFTPAWISHEKQYYLCVLSILIYNLYREYTTIPMRNKQERRHLIRMIRTVTRMTTTMIAAKTATMYVPFVWRNSETAIPYVKVRIVVMSFI